MREREMKECVYAEACEGMLEDMPVTATNSKSLKRFRTDLNPSQKFSSVSRKLLQGLEFVALP